MSTPVVFISYSHDSPAHKDWVKRLAADLREKGVDAILDQWRLALGEDVAAFMEASIARADRVLLVCTENYVDRADAGAGGVGYERLVVTGELVAKIDTKKFVPIVRQSSHQKRTPHFLGARRYLDFSGDAEYSKTLEELLSELHGRPVMEEPPLGASPFDGVPPAAASPARVVSIVGSTPSGRSVTQEPWFVSQFAAAETGLARVGRKGAMEIRAALHEPATKSQIELLNSVRKSEIKTFGWPIGILLENRDEFRPRPTTDGIAAEVAIMQGLSCAGFRGHHS